MTQMSEPRIWQKMTLAEIREALKTTKTVLIPVGCTEQHGYHMTTDVDNHNAWQFSIRASERTGAFVAPLLAYTFSGGELPGTLNINPNVVSLMTMEILRAFAFHGIKNLVIVLGHGGTENNEAVTSAANHFLRNYPGYADCNVAVYRFWEVCPAFIQAFEDHDYHAANYETSLMMHWAADEVYPERMAVDREDIHKMMYDDCDAYQIFTRRVDAPGVVAKTSQHPEIEVGVMGDPFKANAEYGEALCEEAVSKLVELIEALQAV